MPSLPSKYILLAIKGQHVEPRLLSYASSLCRRMDAGLDIMLTCEQKTLPPLLDQFLQELHRDGIPSRLTQESGLGSRNIVQYANTHGNISTVVIDTVSTWTTPGYSEHRNPWHKLECPLVVAIPD
jgi:hypothetical protein